MSPFRRPPLFRQLPFVALCVTVVLSHSPASLAEPGTPVRVALSATVSSDFPPAAVPAADIPDTEAHEGDLWQRIRDGMAMRPSANPLIRTHARWYAAQPAYLRASIERSRRYLHYIVDQIEARGMPMEIALLPIIESAYNPQALSPMQASGLWQFIPSTGKVFGLRQNDWYDGRRDVVAATRAALDYLQKLHAMFGDWELALAAYNCGEGCVANAIARNRAKGLSTDYAELSLPAETRNYVPKLMAVRAAILEPERFGLDLDPLPDEPYFRKVNLPYPIEAKTAVKLAEMEMREFLALNPGFRRRVIHSDSQSVLLLPVDRVDVFRANLAETESRQIRLRPYQAKKGELLSRIAERFDVTVQWLVDHNPLATKRGKLARTQTLLVPPAESRAAVAKKFKTSAAVPAVMQAEPPRPQTTAAGAIMRGHLVRRGDTLATLAKRYRVTVAQIRDTNRELKSLRTGDIVLIPING